MDDALSLEFMTEEQNRRISETVEREQGRLRNFIRRRVLDESDVEDILQEVFYELVQAYRLMKPLEQVGAWLFRVARNRIIDRFRGRRQEAARPNPRSGVEEAEMFPWEALLPSPMPAPMRPTRARCSWKKSMWRWTSFRRNNEKCSWPMNSRGGVSAN